MLLSAIIILCIPMIYYAGTSPKFLTQKNGSKIVLLTVCESALPNEMMSFFICYMFMLGFVLPLIIISTCYFFLIRHLRRNNSNIHIFLKSLLMALIINALFPKPLTFFRLI